MVDVANLSANVEFKSVRAAKDEFDNLAKSAGRLGDSMIAAQKKMDAGAQGLINKTMQLGKVNKSAEASAATFAKEIDREAASFRKLQSQLDPMIAIQARFKAQTDAINSAVRRGIVTQEEANRTLLQAKTAYDTAAAGAMRFGAANAGSSRGMNRMASAATQAGFQIQDFAVQVAAGTSPILAMNQQLPQLLGAFGSFGKIALVGSILGTIAAVLGAILPKVLALFDGVEQLTGGMKALSEATSDYSAITGKAIKDLSDLEKTYGTLSNEAQRFLDIQRGLQQAETQTAVSGQLGRFTDPLGSSGEVDRGQFDTAIAAQETLIQLEADYQTALAAGDAQRMNAIALEYQAIQQIVLANDNLRIAVADIADQYGIAETEARAFAVLLRNLADEDTLGGQARAVDDITTFLEEAKNSAGGLSTEGETLLGLFSEMGLQLAEFKTDIDRGTDAQMSMNTASDTAVANFQDLILKGKDFAREVMKAYENGDDLSKLNLVDGILPAANAAMVLAEQLGISVQEAQKLVNLSAMTAGMGPSVAGGRGEGAQDPRAAIRTEFEDQLDPDDKKKSGRSGLTDAEREQQRMEREGVALKESLYTAQEQYNASLARYQELMAAGAISSETFERAQQRLNEQQAEAQWETTIANIETISAGLMQAAMNGENLGEALIQMLAQMAIQWMSAAIAAKAADILSGGILSASMAMSQPGFGGGGVQSLLGFATGTKNAPGGMAMVGEQGPEIVNLPRGSEVIPAARTSQMVQQMSQPQINVAPAVPEVVVISDPRKIDEYRMSPRGEKARRQADERMMR